MATDRALKLGCLLLVTCALCAQDPKQVRIGVAVMQNSSNRPFPSRDPRDRLVQYLNSYAKRGQPKIEAVALEATSRAVSAAEASAKHCDYVVYTTLMSLVALNRPGEIRVGTDPIPQPPGPPYKGAPIYAAVMSFELVHHGGPLLRSSINSEQRITADDMVAVLMSKVAERVRTEIAKARP